jgi:uncharacterized membrane protein YccC
MIGREAHHVAIQIALVSLASYACGEAITGYVHGASAMTGGMWAVMSGIVVLQQARGQPVSVVWRHILATLVGAAVAASYLSLLPFNAIGLAASIFVGVLLSHAFRIPREASLAALAIGVVMVVSSLHPTLHPLLSAVLRFIEACIGTVMASLAIVLWPVPPAGRPGPRKPGSCKGHARQTNGSGQSGAGDDPLG